MLKKFMAGIAALLMLTCVAPAGAQSRDGRNREVVIINNTSSDMIEFHASNIGTDEWQEDILGSSILRAHRRITMNIDDGTGYCLYDFKAVFDDGVVTVRRRVNVCTAATFTYND